jgi:hypothetical protein
MGPSEEDRIMAITKIKAHQAEWQPELTGGKHGCAGEDQQ